MVYSILSIVSKLNELSDEARKFILDHVKTGPFQYPLFWIGIFLVGVALFFFTYKALQKEM